MTHDASPSNAPGAPRPGRLGSLRRLLYAVAAKVVPRGAMGGAAHTSPDPRQLMITSDFEEVVLPEEFDIPAQISPGERRFLYWLVSRAYKGSGAIVELGTWLGSSTMHLACGLRDSGVPGKLYSYDAFIWGGRPDNVKSGLNLQTGSDFSQYFQKYTDPLSHLINVEKADFGAIVWPPDQPVEILFLDGPKDARLLSIALSIFAPALRPETTMVVFQDYQHPPSYDLALAAARLGTKLELRQCVASGGTVSFLLREPLTRQDTTLEALSTEGLAYEEILRIWEKVLANLQGPVRNRLLSGKALHLCELGHVDEAVEILRTVKFDQRLHAGWRGWSRSARMQGKYQPLFDLYQQEFDPSPPSA